MEQLLFYAHYALLLIFGVVLSAAFSGIPISKRNLIRLFFLTALCGGLQITVYGVLGETAVWYCYPFITHTPILLALQSLFGISFSGSLAAVATAYLCCQPARWFGLAAYTFTESTPIELFVRIIVLLVTLSVILRWFAGKIAQIYGRRHRSTWVFGITPVVYYLFDYVFSIYSNLWAENHQLVVEFLPLFLCAGHLLFCTVYYRGYELKNEAERKEQLLRITVEQQTREVEMIRRSEAEIRLLRHDFRLLLNSLSACIEHADSETAQKLIAGFSIQADAASIKRFCGNDTLNYVLSDYAAQCQEKRIPFHPVIELSALTTDEVLFSTILANALDNALNAQEGLPDHKRGIRLMLKNSSGKTLLCVKNSFKEPPIFQDGSPVTSRQGHGYGTQSIRYVTEKLGGNCQFSLEEDCFVLRVVV